MTIEKNLLERIYSKVDLDEGNLCWRHHGSDNGKGYMRLSVQGKLRSVHRIMYEIFFGEIPPNMEVHHTCSTRNCCNPAHLTLLSHQLNVALQDKWVALRMWRLKNLVEIFPELAFDQKVCVESSELQHIFQCRSDNLPTLFETMKLVYGDDFQCQVVMEIRGKPRIFEVSMGHNLVEQLNTVEDDPVQRLLDSLFADPAISVAD